MLSRLLIKQKRANKRLHLLRMAHMTPISRHCEPHSAPDDSWTPDESVSSEKEREEGRNGTAGPRGVQHRTIGPGLTWRPQKVQRHANGRPRCPHDPDEAFDATPPHQPVRGAPCTPKTSGPKKEQKTNWSGAVAPPCRPPRPGRCTRRLVTLRRRAPSSKKRRGSSGTATRCNCRK